MVTIKAKDFEVAYFDVIGQNNSLQSSDACNSKVVLDCPLKAGSWVMFEDTILGGAFERGEYNVKFDLYADPIDMTDTIFCLEFPVRVV